METSFRIFSKRITLLRDVRMTDGPLSFSGVALFEEVELDEFISREGVDALLLALDSVSLISWGIVLENDSGKPTLTTVSK